MNDGGVVGDGAGAVESDIAVESGIAVAATVAAGSDPSSTSDIEKRVAFLERNLLAYEEVRAGRARARFPASRHHILMYITGDQGAP